MSSRLLVKAVRYITVPVYVQPTATRSGQRRKGYNRLQRMKIKPPALQPAGPSSGSSVPGMDSQSSPAPLQRYNRALELARRVHAAQTRKGTENARAMAVPYITHPVAVSALVVRYGGDEEQACAALLHDVLEDGGPQWRETIAREFGPRVLSMVEACTDAMPDASGKKAPWQERKTAYIASFARKSDDALLVAACDKLHNLQSIVQDRAELGDAVFERFSSTKAQTLWYYTALVQALAPRMGGPLARALKTGLSQLLG